MFLPVSKKELGDAPADFIVVCGDAYVDHPSFGHAIIARILHDAGFSVAMMCQPVCDTDYTEFGAPRLAFLVASGVVDSMVNNYTVGKRRRKGDDYSESGKGGRRPDRAVIHYTRELKRLFPDTFVIIGGIEASLRRFAHYDYWSDQVMRSVLFDSGADLLIYGMGEKPLFDITALLKKHVPLRKMKDVRGTACLGNQIEAEQRTGAGYLTLNSFRRVSEDKEAYARSFMTVNSNSDSFGRGIVQKQDEETWLIANPPAALLTTAELDYVYSLPYERNYHPSYESVPSIEEVKFSLVSHRGCFGNCSFCALNLHQGREIVFRSEASIIAEAEKLIAMPDFKGYIHDVGGPSANFRKPSCKKQAERGVCKDKNCVGYKRCAGLEIDHSDYLGVLRKLCALPGVKKVFIRSGIRFDYLLYDKDKTAFREIVRHHISGQLKVAPEHVSDRVLKLMNKPAHSVYSEFSAEFKRINSEERKDQYLVPYYISSHPGCTLSDAVKLAEYLKSIKYNPLQVQDFYPTPGTLSTTMYYTGLDPRTMQPVFCEKTEEGKAMQRALMQFNLPQNYNLVKKALILANRPDLIGNDAKCLIKDNGKDKQEVVRLPSSKDKRESERSVSAGTKTATSNTTSKYKPAKTKQGKTVQAQSSKFKTKRK